MSEQFLHIVSFNVPYPADYGGVIDVFYKIRHLSQAGVKIILHCFDYGRGKQKRLNDYCEQVYYYPRQQSIADFFSNIPYIVKSRKNSQLLENLCKDSYPILFEGLHTCSFLSHSKLKNRIKIVRAHNVEHEYYQGLAKYEPQFLKKSFYLSESAKLEQYCDILNHATAIVAISPPDKDYFSEKFPNTKVIYLPPFHPYDEVEAKAGMGKYALTHGSFAVSENAYAVLWLIENVFSKSDYPLMVAGSSISTTIKQAATPLNNIRIESPSPDEMKELIKEAHINVLPAFQSSGMKLKLLSALFAGRHCVVNPTMLADVSLSELCVVASTANDFLEAILSLRNQPFTESDILKRKSLLIKNFSNSKNAEVLKQLIFGVNS